MSKKILISKPILTDISDSLRKKYSPESKFKPTEMAKAIDDIPEIKTYKQLFQNTGGGAAPNGVQYGLYNISYSGYAPTVYYDYINFPMDYEPVMYINAPIKGKKLRILVRFQSCSNTSTYGGYFVVSFAKDFSKMRLQGGGIQNSPWGKVEELKRHVIWQGRSLPQEYTVLRTYDIDISDLGVCYPFIWNTNLYSYVSDIWVE